jgi:phospholipase C
MAMLDQIKTIVIVMMENRSFDNVLGHLSVPAYGNRKDVEGLDDPENNPVYTNFLDGIAYQPSVQKDQQFLHDLPHGRDLVATQLAESSGNFTMSGFVKAYKDSTASTVVNPPPMGFLIPSDVPVSNFFAQQYLICDHWFSPLPADTQPNRSVAYSGYSLIDDTKGRSIPVPDGSFIFDWLKKRKVSWRVYHSGLSFFMLFDRFEDVLGSKFCNIRELAGHIDSESVTAMPQVIFIEPEYTDSPVHFGGVNDNHPPTPIGPGEHFLRDIYSTLSKNPDKWKQTLLIVTCDEHGGFFDHVAPPKLGTPVPPDALFTRPFDSMGSRVPAFIISPLIKAGTVFKGIMDHTSILQLLAEKFDPGHDYNDEVKRRRLWGVKSVSDALSASLAGSRAQTPAPPNDTFSGAVLVPPTSTTPTTGNPAAFTQAARKMMKKDWQKSIKKFPELLHLPDQ